MALPPSPGSPGPLRVVHLAAPDRADSLRRLLERALIASPAVEEAAARIVRDVRARGDQAVREATERFEGRRLERFELSAVEWSSEADRVEPAMAATLERAHARIRRFHEAEAARVLGAGFSVEEEGPSSDERAGGIRLGLHVRPLARAGLYAPGGTARYPSTVLMTAAPARAAGVGELVLVTPGPSPETLFAARLAGVDRVFAIGGAQAVGALAYGTETVPRVDKIVGPGNAYVAAAKRLVFGDVDIDQVAGPSEVLIVADHGADPRVIAADLLAQAEHDVDAYAVLVTDSDELARQVAAEVGRQLEALPRREIAQRSIERNGAAVVVRDLDEARDFADRFAPEHLELHLRDGDGDGDDALVERFPNAGALFLGAAPEAIGDYYAGPNHVLPTGGSARFSSPLGVHDFVKRTSIIRYSDAALLAHADDVIRFAEAEGLSGHARSIAARVDRIRAGRGRP